MERERVRVLLVEDDEDDYVLTRDWLREIGAGRFELEWAKTFDAGRAALASDRFDVCLLDYRLGGGSGLELLREAGARHLRAPIILLTGQQDRDLDVEAMHTGAADYLVKGRIDASALERSIRYAMERRRAEAQLREAREELERRVAERTAELARANEALLLADRRKDDFLALLGHELRNPLAPIRNAVAILGAPAAGPAEVRLARDMIGRQTEHLTRLIDDLLDVSRITRGKVRLRKAPLNLAELLRAAADDRRPHLEAARLTLELDLPTAPVWVEGDAVRLTQVVGNLLHNAMKFTDPGGRVTLRAVASADGVTVTLRDTGVGIEPASLPRLFEAFAQVEQTLERSQGGLGLGLALVKGLAELHGGTVEAASDGPGTGATFTVRLPTTAAPPAPAAEGGAVSAAKRRVLIVEDNRDAGDSLALLLGLMGHEVTVRRTGADGVDEAARFRPDLVLCDLGLPGMSGYDVARALRGAAATARVRLVALTGYGQPEDRRRSREAGFDDHLVKPIDPEELRRLLEGN